MELKANVKLHNRFDIEVRGLDGKLKQTAQAENIVLDSMWTRLCNGYTYFENIHYGSGTGILSASRTSLFTHTGTATATTEEIIRGVPNTSWKRKNCTCSRNRCGGKYHRGWNCLWFIPIKSGHSCYVKRF